MTPGGELLHIYGGGLAKVSPDGKLVVSNSFEGVSLHAVATLTGGDFYLAGYAETNTVFGSKPESGLFVAKLDPVGRSLWVRQGEGWALPQDADVDVHGGVIIGGEALGSLSVEGVQTDGYDGPFLCRLDSEGRVLWLKRVQTQYADSSHGRISDIAVAPSGDILVGGYLDQGMVDFDGIIVEAGSSGTAYGGDWFIAKYSPEGVAQWVRLGYGEALTADKRGNVYAGFFWPKNDYRGGIARFSSDGELVWNKELPVPGRKGITLDERDRPVFCSSFSWGGQDVGKIDEDGKILWVFGGQGQGLISESMQVQCDARGNIYLFARFMKFRGNFDQIPVASLPSFDVQGHYTGVLARLSERPPLALGPAPTGLQLFWPSKATNYVLEATTAVKGDAWAPLGGAAVVSGRDRRLTVTNESASKFFRLRKP